MKIVETLKGMLHMGGKTAAPVSPEGVPTPSMQETRTTTSLTPEADSALVGMNVAGPEKPLTSAILEADARGGIETTTTTIPSPANPAPAENKG